MTNEAAPAAERSTGTSTCQSLALAVMRIAIGWHFLYEGIVKLLDPGWTAAGYLQSSTGPLAGTFQWMAANPTRLEVVDQLNTWGLIIIGGCLMLGLFSRLVAACGIALLALYYVAHPPWLASAAPLATEGHYLWVDKNLVELLALCVVLAFPARTFGLDAVISAIWHRRGGREQARAAASGPRGEAVDGLVPGRFSRRQVLAGLTGVPFLGGLTLAVLERHGWTSHERKQLSARLAASGGGQLDAITSASKTYNWATLEDLKDEPLPQGRIGDLRLSRMILGGNLIGGWAHARDLIYVDKLVKAYHHREKIFETFRLAEACGVNTVLTNPLLGEVINDYWKRGGGKIQFISDCGGDDLLQMIQKSIDHGACACYIQGGVGDNLVAEGKFDLIEKALELIRRNHLPAGIGGHKLRTIAACVEKGFQPDFWMKTLHHTDYWSAQIEKQNDNIWCEEPRETVALMKDLPQPWIAFKVLGAGAIQPKVGFKYAFEGGADFICVGMYDFQIVDDVNVALEVLGGKLRRERRWLA